MSTAGDKIRENDTSYFGKHIIADFWGINIQDKFAIIEKMKNACIEAGATVLNSNFHDFDGDGFTGVIILAESHMSIHTWPQYNFVAIDVFLCGDCDPWIAINALQEFFEPKKVYIREYKRGLEILPN